MTKTKLYKYQEKGVRKMKGKRKIWNMFVYITLDDNIIDRVYFNRRAALRRKRILINTNLHYPSTHYTIETHMTRGCVG